MIFPADTASVSASVSFVDRLGHAAKVDGIPAWQMTGDPIGDLLAADDGMSAAITLNGSLGLAQVAVRADADMSGEIRELIVTGDLEIVSAEAVAGSITFSLPSPPPAP